MQMTCSREILATGLTLAVSLGFSGLAYCGRPDDTQPNIVVVLTDDQGYGDLGCYGAQDIATPNIDRLCDQGMKFESFYVHNRCSPTRAAFMTGCYAHRIGMNKVIYRKDRKGLNADEVTLAELLRDAGYATGIVGKWHLGEFPKFNPIRHGFDLFYGFMEYDDSKSTAIYRGEKIVERIQSKTDGVHSEKLLTAALDFIHANQRRPFFLYYASPLPHTRWKPSTRFSGTSAQGVYGDVVQEIDWQVGALMTQLDELGLSDNTIFLFASDNGPQLNIEGHGSAGILRDGKWTDFEGGIRVPCIVRWPDHVKPGTTNADITCVMDLLPTFCDVAGVAVPQDRVIDGRSILPCLDGQKTAKPIHETFIVPGSTIRYRNWKLLLKAQKPGGSHSQTRGQTDRVPAAAGSLFNLGNDLGETKNVAAQNPEIVAELTRRMNEAMRELEINSRKVGTVAEDRKSN